MLSYILVIWETTLNPIKRFTFSSFSRAIPADGVPVISLLDTRCSVDTFTSWSRKQYFNQNITIACCT